MKCRSLASKIYMGFTKKKINEIRYFFEKGDILSAQKKILKILDKALDKKNKKGKRSQSNELSEDGRMDWKKRKKRIR